MKKIFNMVRKTVSVIVVGFILCLAVLVLSVKASGGEPTVFNHQFKSVLSGSMEPTFKTGSIITIELTDDGKGYTKGDVLTFIDKNENLVTHRIIEVEETKKDTIYTTKGDNNDGSDVDPVLSQNVVGEYTGFTIPYIGFLINYASSKTGAALLLFIPGAVLFLYAIFSFRKAVEDFKKEHSAPASDQS
ncbi:signal peptidase I SipW [Halobacillus faecis]